MVVYAYSPTFTPTYPYLRFGLNDYNYTTGSWQTQGHLCDRNVPKCDVVVTSTIISYADEKREWVEVGFAWIFDVFRE